MCLPVCLRWSPCQTVAGTTRPSTPFFGKPLIEGRRLSDVVACEVRALPFSLGCPFRPACCLWFWL